MTTIVGTKFKMCSDSKVNIDRGAMHDTSFSTSKIMRIRGALVGTAGEVNNTNKFEKWFGTKRAKPRFSKNADFEALVLSADGKLYHYDETCSPSEITQPFFAIGSGAHAALGALHAGATPELAVEIAIKIDTLSGGDVQTLELYDEDLPREGL